MNTNILNVNERALFDNSIVNAEKHTHQPFASSTLNNNDEIRIQIQQHDMYTLPWNSLLYIEGQLLKKDNTVSATAKLINNGIAFLFDEIRYEVGGIVIDRIRNPGIASTIKGYISYSTNESLRLQNAAWSPLEDISTKIVNSTNGHFNVCIPLRMFLGFAEDFRKIILNLRQELVLIRSNTDVNAIYNEKEDEEIKINLTKVLWKMPHITVADAERLMLMQYIETSSELEIGFRSWELHEFPLLQQARQHTWAVKTATQLEKPRFVIVGFQTKKKNKNKSYMSYFDHCKLTNIKLYLNSEIYPYDNLNLNFDNNQFAMLYEMYAQFQQSYYEKINEPVLTPDKFKSIAPITVIDCSHQNETLMSGPVDIRLEFETGENIPSETTAYCLILHDRLVRYNPLTNAVRAV